jgi:hypothetical protein
MQSKLKRKQDDAAVMLQACILEMLGSNLGRAILTEEFHGLPQYLQVHWGIMSRLGDDRLSSNPF